MLLLRIAYRTTLFLRKFAIQSSSKPLLLTQVPRLKAISYHRQSAVEGLPSSSKLIFNTMRSMSSSKIDDMTSDPARNLNHEAMISRKKDGSLLIIDVREPAELAETGVVPDSINIPLKSVEDALGPMTPEAFRQTYGAEKPTKGTLIVFSCHSGKRSRAALGKALALGYLNSSHYEGGWLEWAKHLNRN